MTSSDNCDTIGFVVVLAWQETFVPSVGFKNFTKTAIWSLMVLVLLIGYLWIAGFLVCIRIQSYIHQCRCQNVFCMFGKICWKHETFPFFRWTAFLSSSLLQFAYGFYLHEFSEPLHLSRKLGICDTLRVLRPYAGCENVEERPGFAKSVYHKFRIHIEELLFFVGCALFSNVPVAWVCCQRIWGIQSIWSRRR